MVLPKRVQQALDQANAAEADYVAQRSESTAPAVQNVISLVADNPDPASAAPPASPPASAAPAPAASPKEDFEHKYRVLQGMYAADVTAIKGTLASVSGELAALKQAQAAPPAPDPVAEKDIQTFGADLIEMVKRYVEGQQVKTDERLAALEQKVSGVSAQTEEDHEARFFEKLVKLAPSYKEINADPRWLKWLGVVDPMYREPRQLALDRARADRDADAVGAMLNAFLASLPAQQESPLSEQVVPSSAGSPPPPQEPARPILSEKSITDFYRDVGRGVYQGREAEQARLETLINSAVAEGRVR